MSKQHNYTLSVKWTGNRGQGTIDYKAYDRYYTVSAENKVDILACSDVPFLGDKTKHSPEDFLLTSLSSCHMLWYLHICADAGIVVVDYVDNPTGILVQDETGGGKFTEVSLNPIVTITDASKMDLANELHKKANEKCFIANSVNFKVKHNSTIQLI